MNKKSILFASLFPAISSGDSFPLDGFGYTVGDQNLAGINALVDGFEGEWLGAILGGNSPGIVLNSLDYPGTASHGGAVQFTGGGNARVGRLFEEGGLDNSTEGIAYFSIRMQPDSVSGAYRALEFHKNGFNDGADRVLQISTGEIGLVEVGLVPSGEHFSVRLLNENTTEMAGDLGLADNEVSLFIIKFDLSLDDNSDAISVWRNPADLTDETMNPPAFSATGFDLEFDRLTFARFGDAGITFDEIRLGDSWSEVTTEDQFDTDNDGLRDDWEYAFDLNPFLDDSGNDTDLEGGADGLTHLQELTLGTDPQKADTDGDLLLDGVETNTGIFRSATDTGTDPNQADTDGDTFLDGDEVMNMTNPNDIDDPGDPNEGIIFLDGTKEDAYGNADAVQTVETGFGDNLSELNAAYTKIQDDKLFLFISGNVEANFNKLEIFIDSTDAVTTNVFTSAGNDGSANMNGMTFDTDFSPDYHFILRRGESKVDLDYANLATQEYVFFENVFRDQLEGNAQLTEAEAMTSTFTTYPAGLLGIAYNDSNTMGIGGNGGAAADQAAALAVTTGIELSLSSEIAGDPNRPVKIMVLQNNGDHNYLSNQTLGGLPIGTTNLGSSAGLDFRTFDGDQFFVASATVEPPEITIFDLRVDGEVITLNVGGLIEGGSYHLQASANLSFDLPFLSVPESDFIAGGSSREIEITSTEGKYFYRVVSGFSA